MDFFSWRVPTLAALLPPANSWGWLLWLALLGLALWLGWRSRPEFRVWTSRQWLVFGSLLAATILSLFVFVLRLPPGTSLGLPATSALALGAQAFMLAALPWMLASALLGPTPGMLIAVFSGLGLALIETRNPFTPLEFALAAFIFAWALRQPYRTSFFVWLRRPWFAALILSALLLALLFFDALLWLGGDLTAALAFVLPSIGWVWLAEAIPILLAGLLITGLARFLPAIFPRVHALAPSPTEGSLQARIFSALIPVAILLFSSLVVVVWIVAGQSSRESVYNDIQNSLDVASQNLPFLLDTGQDQIIDIARDPILNSGDVSQVEAYLAEKIQQVPYFEQFVLLNAEFNTLAAFPIPDFQGIQPSENELEAIQRAFSGLALQSLTVPPLSNLNKGGQLSYIATVPGSPAPQKILLGRSQIESNPFAQAILQSLDNFAERGGRGLLIDGAGTIVYDSLGQRVQEAYAPNPEAGIQLINPAIGPPMIRGFQPVFGSQWSVAIEIPASTLQTLALSIALPQILLILLLGGLSALVLRFAILRISHSIDSLALARSDHSGLPSFPAQKSGDELSRLSTAVQSIRQELQDNETQSAALLGVHREISSGAPLPGTLETLVDLALKFGASAARIAIGGDKDRSADEFGAGRKHKNYRFLDRQLLDLVSTQKRVLLSNPGRAPLDFGRQIAPEALAAFALEGPTARAGVLWLAFDSPQSFPPEQVAYYEDLAALISLAITSNQSHRQNQRESNQFHQILEESLDPVLLSSPDGDLLFANRAARSLLSAGKDLVGVKLRDFPQLSALQPEKWVDVRFPDGRVFSVKALEIKHRKRLQGIGLLMRDTTSEQQAKALRSEFLTTISHELQDPIKLLRGYLTMLDMTGDLNEKQAAYMEKIGESVSGIADLVSNLFDLERIESDRGLQLTTFPLAGLLDRVRQQTQARAKQKQVQLQWDLDQTQTLTLDADETLIERAIFNLVDQAVRRSPRGERVQVSLHVEEGLLRFSVSDKGSGIAPMDLPHVFERLGAKGDDSQSPGHLTLSIVRSIIERHGGKVWADSQLGEGSTFYFEIPTANPLKE